MEDRGAWRAAVHGVSKSWTRLGDWTELKISVEYLRLYFFPILTTSSLKADLLYLGCFLEGFSLPDLYLHFKKYTYTYVYLSTWLHQVLAEAHSIFTARCELSHPVACGTPASWPGNGPASSALEGRPSAIGPPGRSYLHSSFTMQFWKWDWDHLSELGQGLVWIYHPAGFTY